MSCCCRTDVPCDADGGEPYDASNDQVDMVNLARRSHFAEQHAVLADQLDAGLAR